VKFYISFTLILGRSVGVVSSWTQATEFFFFMHDEGEMMPTLTCGAGSSESVLHPQNQPPR
jgi:hypothetical protein